MDGEQFREASKEMTDYIISYQDNIRDRRVLPTVEPGYIRSLLPAHAPVEPEEWRDVMADIEKIIMPGVTHWQSPNFHAYYPCGNSYPGLLADMLSAAIGCNGFSWLTSPACTELEVLMMDWLGQIMGLPSAFLACSGGTGGGVIQGTACESTFVAVLAARSKTLKDLEQRGVKDVTHRLMAYCSDQAHTSVEKASMLAGIKIRKVASDSFQSLRGEELEKVVKKDKEDGLIPFIVVGTMGTTNSCAYDNLREIGEVAKKYDIWHHVDAAYAGAALVCEEFRGYSDGLELAHSFVFNPHKWLLVNFDCSAMWFKDSRHVVENFNVDAVLYLKPDFQGKIPDYRHWQIQLGRRFRSLKLWFVIRMYGRSGLQDHIRKQVCLAQRFEGCVKTDPRFQVVSPATLGLVTFFLKDKDNEVNEALLKRINAGGIIHMIPAKINDLYFLRFTVGSRLTEAKDIDLAWREVVTQAETLLH